MARYKDAIQWMVANDDTEWCRNGDPLSVTACLVADLFGKDDDQVRKDLERALARNGSPAKGGSDAHHANDLEQR
jgi:hypothetical protein